MSSLVPIVCNQVITVLIGGLGVKLISAFIPEGTFGHYALFLTLAQLGVMVTHSGIVNHAMRYWQRERTRETGYTRFLWKVSWRGLAFLLPLLLVITVGVTVHERDPSWLWVFPWLVLGNMIMAVNTTATGVLNAGQRLWAVFVLSMVANAARILIPVGLALATGMTFFNLSAGFALHGLVVFGCLWVMFRGAFAGPPAPEETARPWVRELKEYGRPFALLGIGAWLLQSADRWVVNLFFDERQVGLFAFATNLGAFVPTFVVGGIMQRVFPDVFRQADQARSRAEWRQIARRCDQVTVLFVGLAVGGLLALKGLCPYLVPWLISAKYVPALDVLLPAGFAMITSQVNQFYYLLLQGQHNSAGMVRVMMAVAGLKTLGSVAAAAISWPAFLVWLMASTVICGWLGRRMIRGMALQNNE